MCDATAVICAPGKLDKRWVRPGAKKFLDHCRVECRGAGHIVCCEARIEMLVPYTDRHTQAEN